MPGYIENHVTANMPAAADIRPADAVIGGCEHPGNHRYGIQHRRGKLKLIAVRQPVHRHGRPKPQPFQKADQHSGTRSQQKPLQIMSVRQLHIAEHQRTEQCHYSILLSNSAAVTFLPRYSRPQRIAQVSSVT